MTKKASDSPSIDPSSDAPKAKKTGAPKGNTHALKSGRHSVDALNAFRSRNEQLWIEHNDAIKAQTSAIIAELGMTGHVIGEGIGEELTRLKLLMHRMEAKTLRTMFDKEGGLAPHVRACIELAKATMTGYSKLLDQAQSVGASAMPSLTQLCEESIDYEERLRAELRAEIRAELEAELDDRDRAGTSALDEPNAVSRSAEGVQGDGGRGIGIHGETSDDDADRPKISDPEIPIDSNPDTHKKDLKVTPTIEVGCNVKTRDPYSDPRHPANRWVRGDDVE